MRARGRWRHVGCTSIASLRSFSHAHEGLGALSGSWLGLGVGAEHTAAAPARRSDADRYDCETAGDGAARPDRARGASGDVSATRETGDDERERACRPRRPDVTGELSGDGPPREAGAP